jgi:hypothetical protein
MPEVNELLKTAPEVSTETQAVQPREIIVDQKPEAFVPRNIESFLQKLEKDPVAQSTFDPNGQPQLTSSPPINPKLTLPITRTNFVDGFKRNFDEVAHWLSVFLFREIKIKQGQVIFKSPNDT